MVKVVLLLAILSAQGGARAGTTEDLEAKWRREYPRAAAELESATQNFLAKGAVTWRIGSGETLTTNELTVASSGDKKLIVRDGRTLESAKFQKRPYESDVRCQTPDYGFVLRKQTRTDPYIIVSYADKLESDAVQFSLIYDVYARISTMYMQKTLLQRMQSPSFVVKEVKTSREGGSEVVRIDYTYNGEKAAESGAVYLDPNRNWAIRKVDITKSANGVAPVKFESVVDYQETRDSVFFPKRMDFIARTPRPDVYEHVHLELSQITVGDVVPAETFKLTAYGLPDIPLKPVRESSTFSFRNPLFWGALITAVISFALLRVLRPRTVKT
ncbi:MAG: hypothetical protein ACHRXM_20015 [Isosphaerales bacterium]